jgi:predicted transposase/invertase (TIGR01784 family)
LTYSFNAYIIRQQKVAALLASDNPVSVAVLAALYMIKAGKNNFQRLEFKKKVLEVAIIKKLNKQKSFRLLNFVNHLITLPKDLQEEFQNFTQSPKIQEKMPIDKETLMLFGGKAFAELQQEAIEQGIEKGIEQGIEKGAEKERMRLIMNARRTMGVSAEQIANMMGLNTHYVQSVLDKFEKKA